MREKIWHALMFSLEWRLYAYAITILFLWATTGHLAFAALQALGLQIILFIAQSAWYYFRSEGSGGFTLDALATNLAKFIYHSLGGRRRR